MTAAYREGHHWVGELNFDPRVQSIYSFPSTLTIYDSTIRKILLTPGLRPSVDDLLRVAEALERVGIREMLHNLFWWGEPRPESRGLEVTRAILARGFDFHSAVYVSLGSDIPGQGATIRRAIETVAELRCDSVEVAAPIPRKAEDLPASLEFVNNVSEIAKSFGLHLALGLQDVPRKSFESTVALANEGLRLGVTRLALTDSYSSLSPEALRLWCSLFLSRLVRPVEATMHAHNDFGLGNALAIAAASAGVQPEVSVNNYSYRGGFATLEEVAVALELLYGVDTGIRLEALTMLSHDVAEWAGLAPHPIKPVTGKHAFLRDQPGSIIQHLERGADSFPPSGSCVAASVVGGRMTIVWGDHESAAAIRAKLRQLGLPMGDDVVSAVQQRIRSRLDEISSYPYWLTDAEVDALCDEVASVAR